MHLMIKGTLLAALMAVIPVLAFATTPVPRVNVYAGMSRANITESDVVLSSAVTDHLTSGHSHGHATGGVGVAWDFPKVRNASLGLDFLVFNTTSDGVIHQYGDPDFANYDYRFRFLTRRLMCDAVFAFGPLWQHISPFIKASVGVVSITTKYDESPRTDDILEGDLSLRRRTDYNPAFSVGAGLEKPLTRHLLLSVLYMYTYFGSVKTSRESNNNGVQITLPEPIKAKLQSNTGLVSLGWVY